MRERGRTGRSFFLCQVSGRHMAQMGASHMRLPTSPPGHTHAPAFVHVSHLMGGVHQRGGRRAAHRAAHRGAVGPERSGRSILKLTSLCRCAGPREAAFCILRAMRHRGCYGISGRVFEHRELKSYGTRMRLGFFGIRRSEAPCRSDSETQTADANSPYTKKSDALTGPCGGLA